MSITQEIIKLDAAYCSARLAGDKAKAEELRAKADKLAKSMEETK